MAKSIYIQGGLLYINQRAIPSQSFEVVFSSNDDRVSIFYADGVSKMLQNELITGIANNKAESTFYADRASVEVILRSFVGNPDKVDVAIQDQTTPDISLFMAQELDTFTLKVNGEIDDKVFNITTTGETPVAGNHIMLQENDSFYQVEIKTAVPVTGNEYTITARMPLDFAYTTSANGYLQNVDFTVDVGTDIAPVKFALSPKGMGDTVEWDVTRMVINATMSSAGDEGLFTNISKLTNGLYFRTKNGITQNLFNARDNSDLSVQSAGDNSYYTRSGGGGTFGMSSRVTFNGQDKRGIVKRLKAISNDEFQGFNRDDLTAITSYRVILQGQVVNPN
ncbi:MAG: hypothetical protein IMY67_01830 [Bacteroidetes bacterium]|nr:hypothetical protein [Bacteroidota bacterium]